MASSTIDEVKHNTTQTSPTQIVPVKVGWYGGQGSGKTTSAALFSMGLSKEIYGGAPVLVTDTEPGWQFLKPLFAIEGIEMIQRTEPTFKAMVANLREAEKLGCCVWNGDSLTIIWQELMQSFKAKGNGYIAIDKWGDIKAMWQDYTTLFLNSKMCCNALGRLGNEMAEIEDDDKPGKTKLVKTGTKFKAGGGESFGYEPHLLLELSLERKAKVKAGSRLEGEGRIVHRVDVLKDRTWALNGKVIRWSDKPGYQKGGYRAVWESLKPHFDRVQATMAHVKLQSGSSAELISDNGHSDYYEKKQRRDVLAQELHAAMELLWGGNGKEEKRMRLLVFEHIFGFRSKEAADAAPLQTIERGVRILQAFEKRCKREQPPILDSSELNILAWLDIDIAEYDQGIAEENELPF